MELGVCLLSILVDSKDLLPDVVYNESVGNALFRKPMQVAFTEWFVPSPTNSPFNCSKTAKPREPPVLLSGLLNPSFLDLSVTITVGLLLFAFVHDFLWNGAFLSASASRSVLLFFSCLSCMHVPAARRTKSDTTRCHWQREVNIDRAPASTDNQPCFGMPAL